MKEGIKLAVPLAAVVLHGFETRFGSCFDDSELIVAASTLPQFRLRWCCDDETKDEARALLKRELSSVLATENVGDEMWEIRRHRRRVILVHQHNIKPSWKWNRPGIGTVFERRVKATGQSRQVSTR